MISYKLTLEDGEEMVIYFEQDSSFIVVVDKEISYEFSLEAGALKIVSTVLTHDQSYVNPSSPFVNSERLANVQDLPIAKAPLSNCCTNGKKSYCVEKGCWDSPCGRICAS